MVAGLAGCGGTKKDADKTTEINVGYFNNVTHAQALYMKAQGTLDKAFDGKAKVKWTSFNAGPSEVEIDTKLIPILEDTLKEYDNVTVLNEDILKVDIRKIAEEKNGGKPIKVVANLPYYITTPIIMGLFESEVPLDSITVMVQKEVADRMQVGPGTKDYGALSLAVQYYAEPYIVANVPPNCFIPRPAVGSAVIRLTRYQEKPVKVNDSAFMFKIIRASFNQRRKTLQNGLYNSSELRIPKEKTVAALEEMGLTPTIRGEKLSLEEFAKLSDILGR